MKMSRCNSRKSRKRINKKINNKDREAKALFVLEQSIMSTKLSPISSFSNKPPMRS
ncbi:MAG: hypothetical protein AB1668_02945 [Nanoarchaeota archaeon]